MALNTVEELIEDIRLGRMVILMDDEDRENEGDLVMAASHVRPEDINFMATHARGLICMPMSRDRCAQLNLGLMIETDNKAQFGTPFTMSIEAAKGVTTGISAADRALTVQAAIAKAAKPEDIVQPGHIFPLMAQPGGVLSRAGHTEAGCDLARLAGLEEAAVIVEIMNDDGTMARRPDLEVFAEKHNLKMGTIADLIHHLIATEKSVECQKVRDVETDFGSFQLHSYLDLARGDKHFAFVKGDVQADEDTLVRVQVGSTLKDVVRLHNPRSQHESWNFAKAMRMVEVAGKGVVVLLHHAENAHDIEEELQHLFEDITPSRKNNMVYQQVGTGSQILRDLGVHKMRLMSAPLKFAGLSGFDLEVTEIIECS
jgi:3,4-dihydroxy 2-butanone 4-phosphate synthase/GTP cyclohydrolase II